MTAWDGCGSHPVEIVVTLLSAAAFVYEIRITRKSFFDLDDWLFIKQAGTMSRLLEQYNHALAFSSLLTDRRLMEVSGSTTRRSVSSACCASSDCR